ncbi:unnamed protein product [Protopolystoma xenopodis]|uniref:Uncharacterized protein n=1 Tax=Protopolystoma xenopodis TaxID=117903 RepID=A0A448XIT5_9PLAT|nr:unnamed protein product [Protopolystoma xenopodis]
MFTSGFSAYSPATLTGGPVSGSDTVPPDNSMPRPHQTVHHHPHQHQHQHQQQQQHSQYPCQNHHPHSQTRQLQQQQHQQDYFTLSRPGEPVKLASLPPQASGSAATATAGAGLRSGLLPGSEYSSCTDSGRGGSEEEACGGLQVPQATIPPRIGNQLLSG